MFQYFGHGCRNVSLLWLPKDYALTHLLDVWHQPFHELAFHNKFANNYGYNRAMYLMNSEPFLDTGYLIVRQSEQLHSPLSVLNYQYYDTPERISAWLKLHHDDIQCIVGRKGAEQYLEANTPLVPFGKTQQPMPWDYADGVDTMAWALSL